MTVKELIKILSSLDPAAVILHVNEDWSYNNSIVVEQVRAFQILRLIRPEYECLSPLNEYVVIKGH